MIRVLVCGGRSYADRARLWAQLDLIHKTEGPIEVIIHGCAKGADALADGWARRNKVPVDRFAADWKRYRKAAGPIRNQRMIDQGRPDRLVACPGGDGTADMVRRARVGKIPVLVIQ